MAIKRGADIEAFQEPVTTDRGLLMVEQLLNQFNTLHSMNIRTDAEIDIYYYENVLKNLKNPVDRLYVPDDVPVFMPSSASKCKRELYLHITGNKTKADTFRYPYHQRWTRNSTAIHEATQKDFLYMNKYLKELHFNIHIVDGVPMWEENLKNVSLIEHNGEYFGLSGMMDGILKYNPDNILVGFEYKTKSNTIAQLGDYKMKDVPDYNKDQAVSYSLMFGLNEFMFMYEAVAKDWWGKGAEARADLRIFHIDVTEQMRQDLKQKFVDVAIAVRNKQIPDKEPKKCQFCDYQSLCASL